MTVLTTVKRKCAIVLRTYRSIVVVTSLISDDGCAEEWGSIRLLYALKMCLLLTLLVECTQAMVRLSKCSSNLSECKQSHNSKKYNICTKHL